MGDLIREIALCPNNSNWMLEIQPEKGGGKLLVLRLGRYDVSTTGSYSKSSREPAPHIKGQSVRTICNIPYLIVLKYSVDCEGETKRNIVKLVSSMSVINGQSVALRRVEL
jgi:hypothetical protein